MSSALHRISAKEDANLAAQSARAEAARARAEARRERFLDARVRTIGIDVDALDAQVAVKQAIKQAEREEDWKWGM